MSLETEGLESAMLKVLHSQGDNKHRVTGIVVENDKGSKKLFVGHRVRGKNTLSV